MRKLYTYLFVANAFWSVTNGQSVDTIKVKVHDHVMTLYVSGIGKPTVILEAGLPGSHRNFQKIQPLLASSARVVSYTRPGYLNVDSCSSPRDAKTIAKELRQALDKAGIPPPYIFTGWSFGGALARVFAGLYPKDVTGIVLIDPAIAEFYPRMEKEFPPEVLKEDEKYVKELMASKRIGERAEFLMFDSSMNESRRSDKLYATPTTLLIAAGGEDRDTSKLMGRIWVEELVKWAKKRPNLKYEIIANSGHHIAGQQPDTVSHAIRGYIRQYQSLALKKSASVYKKPDQLNDGLQTSALKDVGLNEKIIQLMVDSIINGNYPNVHSVLIYRNNKLVFENYFPGIDQQRGKGNLGFVDHHRDSLHDLRSVSKTFVGVAVLIAVDQGKIKSLDQRVLNFFPEHSNLDTGMKKDITIKHLLTMSSGVEWSEDLPYTDPRNSETAMDRSNDPVLYVLSQPIVTKPGSVFNYSGGSTQVLAAVVEKATGMPIDQFAAKNIFAPLGINNFTWVKRRDGIPIAASGLRLRSRDMVKFGILLLNNGTWNNKQLISQKLLSEALQKQFTDSQAPPNIVAGFGYHIWIPTFQNGNDPVTVVRAAGNGGQNIFIDKKQNLVAVVTAGNYNNWQIRKSSSALYMDFIYPAMMKR